jgi:hypothetical protein
VNLQLSAVGPASLASARREVQRILGRREAERRARRRRRIQRAVAGALVAAAAAGTGRAFVRRRTAS